MMKKVIVVDSGDTDLNVGVQLSLNNITKINRNALLSGKTPATFKPVLLGISKSSVETDSFLSAASFQETTKVLTDATIKGTVDHLIGLKENVIIGKLIPAGTGMKRYAEVELDTGIEYVEEPEEAEVQDQNGEAEADAESAAEAETIQDDDVISITE